MARILSLLLCVAPLASGAVVGKKRIEPELDPKSDKKFFGPPFPADYPADMRPGGKAQFNYPFPKVQHSAQYDEDFVKDENNDNGEWKAQSEYDRLKTKLHKEQMEVDEAKDKQDKEQKEADVAKSRKEKAEEDAERYASQKDKLKSLQQNVEDKIENLDDCKKELEDAQKKLEDYTKESLATGDLNSVEGEKDAAAAALKKEQDEDVKALKSYDEEKQDVKEAEEALKIAESRLRAMRRGGSPAPPPPPPAPVVEKSGAMQKRVFVAFCAALAAVSATLA